MSVQTPPAEIPLTPPEPEIEAGVIEDARARQRRHRRIGGILLVTAILTGGLIAGFGRGGGGAGGNAGGQPSGSGASGGAVHASASNAFPGAPASQPNANDVEAIACTLAPANRYLPARSGCVTVRRADIDGDGKPDLVIVYSRLSHQHPSGFTDMPAKRRHEFMAVGAFLKVVLANGTSVTTPISGRRLTNTATVDFIAHVSGGPGSEMFLEYERISSGTTDVAYGVQDGRLVPAGVYFSYGGDSGFESGFDCLPGNPPRLIQRSFVLIGPNISGWWQETNVTYAWHGSTLVQISKSTFKRHGKVPASDTGVGHRCTTGVQ